MIEMVTFLVLDNVPVSKKAALDRLAIKFHKTHRHARRAKRHTHLARRHNHHPITDVHSISSLKA
jgi:hypothetical protein